MSANIGLVGVAVVNTSTAIGTSGRAIRVFDVCTADTAQSISLYNASSVSGIVYILSDRVKGDFHSNVGVRFKSGCYAGGGSGIVNYIEEF